MEQRPLTGELTDGVVVLRPPADGDTMALIKGRDSEFHRFIGAGSPDPQPTAVVLDTTGEVVGWIDYEVDCSWLADGEVNVGYNVFPQHRRMGIAWRSLHLLLVFLALHDEVTAATLLIDRANARSLAVAKRSGFQQDGERNGQLFFKRALDADPAPFLT